MGKRFELPETSLSESEVEMFLGLLPEQIKHEGPAVKFFQTVSEWRFDATPLPSSAHICVGCGALFGMVDKPVSENGASFSLSEDFRRWHVFRAVTTYGADKYLMSAWAAINMAAMFKGFESRHSTKHLLPPVPAEITKRGKDPDCLLQGANEDMSVASNLFKKAIEN